jgi:hypothetical protein
MVEFGSNTPAVVPHVLLENRIHDVAPKIATHARTYAIGVTCDRDSRQRNATAGCALAAGLRESTAGSSENRKADFRLLYEDLLTTLCGDGEAVASRCGP